MCMSMYKGFNYIFIILPCLNFVCTIFLSLKDYVNSKIISYLFHYTSVYIFLKSNLASVIKKKIK